MFSSHVSISITIQERNNPFREQTDLESLCVLPNSLFFPKRTGGGSYGWRVVG